VYFDVNGFEEASTGDRGMLPAVIAGGRDTLAADLLALPGTDGHWVGSFVGRKPSRIEQYETTVRSRAEESVRVYANGVANWLPAAEIVDFGVVAL
jgi:hypothetical protein